MRLSGSAQLRLLDYFSEASSAHDNSVLEELAVIA